MALDDSFQVSPEIFVQRLVSAARFRLRNAVVYGPPAELWGFDHRYWLVIVLHYTSSWRR